MPRLCIVGPLVGRNLGHVTTQGEKLADIFEREGYPVIAVSTSLNRYWRLADIVSTLLRHGRNMDLLMLQVYSGPSFVVADAASWIARRLGLRIVMNLHGGAMPQFMARHPRWCRRVLSRADEFVAPSAFLPQALAPYGFKVKVIPNLIDISAYPFRIRQIVTPRILWMRTFHPIYNPEMAVRVLARLRAAVPEATLVMAGEDKGDESKMRQLATGLGVSSAVRFPGFLDMPGKSREGAAADIFINTNRIDNMPISVVEACAMGLPVVATAVGGIPHLLSHGKTGLLVPDDDDRAMVTAIRSLLDARGIAHGLSTNGRSLAENSSWEQVLPQWERVIDQVMARAGRNQNSNVLGARNLLP